MGNTLLYDRSPLYANKKGSMMEFPLSLSGVVLRVDVLRVYEYFICIHMWLLHRFCGYCCDTSLLLYMCYIPSIGVYRTYVCVESGRSPMCFMCNMLG